MNRRGFLGGLLAAPAIVRAESLMKIWVPPKEVTVWKAGQPGWTHFRFTRGARYTTNYAVQGEGSHIFFPAQVITMFEDSISDKLLRVNFPASALTIENE